MSFQLPLGSHSYWKNLLLGYPKLSTETVVTTDWSLKMPKRQFSHWGVKSSDTLDQAKQDILLLRWHYEFNECTVCWKVTVCLGLKQMRTFFFHQYTQGMIIKRKRKFIRAVYGRQKWNLCTVTMLDQRSQSRFAEAEMKCKLAKLSPVVDKCMGHVLGCQAFYPVLWLCAI